LLDAEGMGIRPGLARGKSQRNVQFHSLQTCNDVATIQHMRPTLILVDGMNIANRSIVAQDIVQRFPKDQVEFYSCGELIYPYVYVRMMRDVLDKRKSVVIESSWRDEYVVERMGDKPSMPRQMTRMLDRIALGCDAVVAFCVADSRTYAENVNQFSSYDKMRDLIDRMESAWREINHESPYPIKVVLTQDDNYKIDIDILMDQLMFRSDLNEGPGIGRWAPGEVVLMVGDRHGPSIQPYKVDMNLAFCDMAKAGSSFWLSDQLDKGGIDEKSLYWINAFDSDGNPTEPRFIALLRPKAIVTLGDSAARWAETCQLQFNRFAHPQFHKRFQHNEPYPLIEKLKELVK
jgi:hypothetical protein